MELADLPEYGTFKFPQSFESSFPSLAEQNSDRPGPVLDFLRSGAR